MRAKSRLLRLCLCAVLTGSVCEAQQAPQIASPPPAAVLEHNLVNVGTIHPPLLQEIRYATMCNFTGQVLYPFPAAPL